MGESGCCWWIARRARVQEKTGVLQLGLLFFLHVGVHGLCSSEMVAEKRSRMAGPGDGADARGLGGLVPGQDRLRDVRPWLCRLPRIEDLPMMDGGSAD